MVSLVMKSADERAGVGGNRGDRQRLRRRRGVDGDSLAGGSADIAGSVDDPRLIGKARRVRGRIDQAPARSVLDHIGPGRAAVAADLDLLSRSESAVGAGDCQRGVVGGEVGG